MPLLFHIRPPSWAHTFHQLLATKSCLPGRHCRLLKFINTLPGNRTNQPVTVVGLLLATNRTEAAARSNYGDTTKRCMATHRENKGKQVTMRAPGTRQGEVTIGKKVAQAGKDASYMGIVIVGIGVTAIMFYAIGRELFASSSPNAVYTKAFKLCIKDEEIIEQLGEPIKGFGETTRRGRRRHVSHLEYEQDGVKHMRMKFYVQGPKRKGTVQLEVKEGETGRYEYRYLFVELDGYPHRTVVLEDNR